MNNNTHLKYITYKISFFFKIKLVIWLSGRVPHQRKIQKKEKLQAQMPKSAGCKLAFLLNDMPLLEPPPTKIYSAKVVSTAILRGGATTFAEAIYYKLQKSFYNSTNSRYNLEYRSSGAYMPLISLYNTAFELGYVSIFASC